MSIGQRPDPARGPGRPTARCRRCDRVRPLVELIAVDRLDRDDIGRTYICRPSLVQPLPTCFSVSVGPRHLERIALAASEAR